MREQTRTPMRIQPNGLVGSYVITQGDRLLMTGLTLQGCHAWIAAHMRCCPQCGAELGRNKAFTWCPNGHRLTGAASDERLAGTHGE